MAIETAPRPALDPEGHEHKNWSDYIAKMGEYVKKEKAYELEKLLLEDHPVLPGEKEAYEWLEKWLEDHHPDRLPRVYLDENHIHVKPREDREE